ncbi:MAG: CYTH and CHAD domain-containing protein [Nakamurella sp.]
MSEHVEVERKFAVAETVPFVDLGSLSGVDAVSAPEVTALDATYFDTETLTLLRAGITLRRRTGGSDAGWHLKLPTGSGDRVEHGVPLDQAAGDADIPTALVGLVKAWVRGHDLLPVGALQTSRTVRRLIGRDGVQLAEAADDVVTAQSFAGSGSSTAAGATVSTWREWEIELIDGPAELIESAGTLMTQAGATPSPSASKLEQALGNRLTGLPVRPTFGSFSPKSRAGDVVQAHLLEQVDAMLGRDGQARRDEPDGVHKMRVATRRLRSALATFRPLLDRTVTDPLRDELKWIAGELGGARDAEVLRTRLLEQVSAEPGDLVLGPISSRIEVELSSDHRKAHDELLLALDSPRYYDLLDRLEDLVLTPPFTELADGRADKVLTKRVRKAFQRVDRLVAAGPGDAAVIDGVSSRDHWFHEIRKAAKRLRYAAESVEPAFGSDAATLAEAAENLQEVLGEHQDSVVARAALRDLGARIHLDGDNAFTIGRLHALEQARGDQALTEFEPAWSALSKKKVLGWLT